MAKFGQGLGAQALPQPSGIGTAQPNGLMAGLQGLFPEQGSKARYDMIMNLVQAGMQGAQASGSPIANFLAPIAGAMIGGRATKRYNAGRTKTAGEMASSLMGNVANDPSVQGYLAVLNNPNAPGFMKSVAQTKLKATLFPKSTKAKKLRPASNTDMLIARVLQSAMNPNSQDGVNISPAEQARLDIIKAARSRSNRVSSGNMSVVDELTGLAGGNTTGPSAPKQTTTNPNDPLGILGLPPA